MGWKSGKNQEKEGESWKKMTTESAFWAGRLIKQEKPRNSTKGRLTMRPQRPLNWQNSGPGSHQWRTSTKGRGSGTVCKDVLPLEPEDLNPTSSVFVLTLNTLLNILGFYFPTCKMPIMPSIHCRVLSLSLSGYCAPGTGLIMFCAISFKIYVTLGSCYY